MLPNKSYVTKEQLEKIEFEISWINKAISRYNIIARGGKEGRAEAISLMKDVRDVHKREKDVLLERPGFGKMLRVVRASALEEAYTKMLDILEGADGKVKLLEQELKAKREQLADKKKLSIR